MGQAKCRGSYNDRRRQAIIRDEANRIREIEKEIDRRANMSEEEKAVELKYKMVFSSYLGFAISSFNNGSFPYKLKG